jgi:nitroimidazol reductase NimA-like FMN-containing flavoprotein (pyridoxamine 5'-phosphate oxidase superfamily)
MQNEHLPREELEREILDFLDSTCGISESDPGPHSCGTLHRTSLVLATSYNDEPRATPLEFFHEGFTIYIFGEPGGKIINIKRNPNVCAAIYEQPLDHSKVQRSLQIWGKAELLTLRNNKKTYMEKAGKWNIVTVLEQLFSPVLKDLEPEEHKKEITKIMGAVNLIRLEPSKMVLRKYRPDFSMPKYEWKRAVPQKGI